MDGVQLEGDLAVPERAVSAVVFAHGSGSSRLSPRNQQVASVLADAGMATLLFDLLTPHEAADRTNVFDIPLLASRLTRAARWLSDASLLAATGGRAPAIGYFGASTGAAAALISAAEPSLEIAVVVSRGGRPDLATERLADVTAPTLLIVGERDPAVLEMNRDALALLRCTKELAVVPRATHLFEEPGTLEEVSRLAARWFCEHMPVG